MRSHSIAIPTWTGRQGEAGAPAPLARPPARRFGRPASAASSSSITRAPSTAGPGRGAAALSMEVDPSTGAAVASAPGPEETPEQGQELSSASLLRSLRRMSSNPGAADAEALLEEDTKQVVLFLLSFVEGR